MNSNTGTPSETAIRNAADNVADLAARIEETVKRTQNRLNELQSTLVDKSKNAVKATDSYVQDNPWCAVRAALGIGFILGLIIARK